MRLIDADALKDRMKNAVIHHICTNTLYNTIMAVIQGAPTIDAVEIVRCKDCKHYSVEGETTRFGWCGYWNKPTDEMRYCSDGKRREE